MTEVCQPRSQPGGVHGFARLQQPPQRAEVEIAVAGFPAAERRHAEAAVPDRAGQGHVQQAQIFRQSFRLRQLEAGLIWPKSSTAANVFAIVVKRPVLFTKTVR